MTWLGRVELALNAAMCAPLTLLASVVWPRHSWNSWVAYSFIGSGLVELVRVFVLEPRSGQYVEVVANTIGGPIGALLALPLTSRMRSLPGLTRYMPRSDLSVCSWQAGA